MVDNNSSILSPLLSGIGSLFPDRIWKSISDVSFTTFYLFYLLILFVDLLFESIKSKRETYNLPKESFLSSFPKE